MKRFCTFLGCSHADELGRWSRLLIDAREQQIARRDLQGALRHDGQAEEDTLRTIFCCAWASAGEVDPAFIQAGQQGAGVDGKLHWLAAARGERAEGRRNGKPVITTAGGCAPLQGLCSGIADGYDLRRWAGCSIGAGEGQNWRRELENRSVTGYELRCFHCDRHGELARTGAEDDVCVVSSWIQIGAVNRDHDLLCFTGGECSARRAEHEPGLCGGCLPRDLATSAITQGDWEKTVAGLIATAKVEAAGGEQKVWRTLRGTLTCDHDGEARGFMKYGVFRVNEMGASLPEWVDPDDSGKSAA